MTYVNPAFKNYGAPTELFRQISPRFLPDFFCLAKKYFFRKKLLTNKIKYINYIARRWGYGGTGRRARLKILFPLGVSVRV